MDIIQTRRISKVRLLGWTPASGCFGKWMTGSGTARTRFAGTYRKVLKVPSLPGPAQVQIFGLEPLASASRILYEGLGGQEVHRVADTADHHG